MSDDQITTAPEVADRRARTIEAALLAALLIVTGVIYFHLLRNRSFFFDEWDVVMDRRGSLLDALLQPHNGHLYLLTFASFRVLFALFGLDHFRPYACLAVAGHLMVVFSAYLVVRQRRSMGRAFAVAIAVAGLGAGWQNTLWPFQMGFMASVAAFLMTQWALGRKGARSDRLASAFIMFGLISSGIGIAGAFAATVRLLVERRVRSLWIVGIPGVVYAAWYLTYAERQNQGRGLASVPGYVGRSFAAAVAGMAGRDLVWGMLVGGILIGLALVPLRRGLGHVDMVAIAGASGCVLFWTLTAVTRSAVSPPETPRYVYVGAVVLAAGVARALPAGRRMWADAAALGLSVACVWGGSATLRFWAVNLRSTSLVVSTELGAMELVHTDSAVPDDYRPDTSRAPQVFAGKYFSAVSELGSPAFSESVIEKQSAVARAEADRVMTEIAARDQGLATAVDAAPDVLVGGDCGGQIEIELPGDGITVENSSAQTVQIGVRRYADAPFVPTSLASDAVAAGAVVHIDLPEGSGTRPWLVSVSAPLAICPLDG